MNDAVKRTEDPISGVKDGNSHKMTKDPSEYPKEPIFESSDKNQHATALVGVEPEWADHSKQGPVVRVNVVDSAEEMRSKLEHESRIFVACHAGDIIQIKKLVSAVVFQYCLLRQQSLPA